MKKRANLINTTYVAAVRKTLKWCFPGVTEKNHQERAKKNLCHLENSKEVHSVYTLRLPDICLVDQYHYLLHLNKR